jgi:polysaccharide deacetylase family protein (PEP-CTERM system associated)
VIRASDWDSFAPRVEKNTQRLIALFGKANVKGTFFTLGWVAERFPQLVRDLHAAGHEVASHGFAHQRANRQTAEEFRSDIRRAKAHLEDLTGAPVKGYRAPTFSIGRENWWAYDVLAEEGYRYSSSLYPVSHDLYGVPDAPTTPFQPTHSPLVEIPLSTVKLFGKNMPCSGGGYFRLLPYAFSRWCIGRVARDGRHIFYCHPWEFDPEQPRIAASRKSRFRHYTNIARMHGRVERLLSEFSWDRMDRVFSREIDAIAPSR